MRTTMVPPDAAPAPGVAGGIGPLGGPPLPGPPTPPEPPALLGPPLPSRTAWPPGPLRTAMRMSVIFKSDAIEFRLTFWGYASRSAQRPSPAAAAPMPRNLRRPIVRPFVDIALLFATKTDSRFGTGQLYPDLWIRRCDQTATWVSFACASEWADEGPSR